MKILFIGGTGIISSACSNLCLKKGHELYLLTRGHSERKINENAIQIKADINNIEECKRLLKDNYFDAVVSWISYTVDDVKRDLEIFKNKTAQYVFISSASGYAKPTQINLTESHKFWNPAWEYSQNKVYCEVYLNDIKARLDCSVTIVRPSHTYDMTKIPLQGYYTSLSRLIFGKPVIIHGDGSTLWTLTHSNDFAKGFLPLLGNERSFGETYHITSDEHLTWDQICYTMAEVLGVKAEIVHVPSDYIMKVDKIWGDGLLGDKAYNMVLDNSKIRSLVPEFKCEIPFIVGAKEIIEYYAANKELQIIDKDLDKLMDYLVRKFSNV